MKIKNLKYLALSAILSLGACSDDYLDTYPTDETSPAEVFKNTDNVEMAVNGLAKIMVSQHLSQQGFNGEGTIKMYYGEYHGNNFRVNLTGWAPIINGQFFDNTTSIYNYYPWHYYYMIINNANEIITKVDGVEGPEEKKRYLKAQALTYRAYSYTMLAQLYGYRWQDSNNGAQECLVIRTSPEDAESLPLAPLKDVYALIYTDLDSAIKLFDEANYTRNANHKIDKDVAFAVYARAAITRQDYETAELYANKAQANYPLMSNAEYKAGFANATSEWIWSSYGASDEQLFFFSYQAMIAYNSSAGAVRTTPKRMSKELYETIPVSDIRKGLFLNPEGYEDQYVLSDGVARADSQLDKDARTAFPDLQKNALVAAYMQFKIKANDMPGVGHLNHFRTSEMYLIEAEAKYFLGKEGEAAAVLEALNKTSGRDAQYTCNLTGAALFSEIVKYRGIELWGEGFDWFDMKRWGLSIDRKSAANGGNYPELLAVKVGADASHKWTWKTPAKEVDFNDVLK